MIPVKDLRLGNFVYHEDLGVKPAKSIVLLVGRVTGIQGKSFVVDHVIAGNNAREIKLTEEWLNKMGFVETVAGSDASHGLMIPFTPVCIQVWKYGSDFIAQLMMYPEYKLSQPKRYVHEIQNLYFALTELEIMP
jgi:hypothetical protein